LRVDGVPKDGELFVPLIPVVGSELYLDQFMAFQRDLDLFEYRFSQTLRPDDHHGMKGMGPGLEDAALGRSQGGQGLRHGRPMDGSGTVSIKVTPKSTQ
jgi:hypothetical protein